MSNAEYMKEYREKNKEKLRGYMRAYKLKKKEESQNNPENTDADVEREIKKEVKSNDPVNEVKERVEKTNTSKSKKNKSKITETPFSPEGFADFSVGLEKTTLTFRGSTLSERDEQHIYNSAKTVGELYHIPKAMALADYGLAMTLPHVILSFDRKTAKEELEIVKLVNDLKSQGYDIDQQLFLQMSENDRKQYITKLEKQRKLKDMKAKFNPKDVVVDD